MSNVTIIPAYPGFFVAQPTSGSEPSEAWLDPVIAWAIDTSLGRGLAFATPITAEDGQIDRDVALVRPDGSVVHLDTIYKSVDQWLSKGV